MPPKERAPATSFDFLQVPRDAAVCVKQIDLEAETAATRSRGLTLPRASCSSVLLFLVVFESSELMSISDILILTLGAVL